MIEKIHKTRCGDIHYWINIIDKTTPTLVFLPGLTADHRLFDKQIEYFENRYNVFVWDAPAHAASWPFTFDFDLMDKARWLHEIMMTYDGDKNRYAQISGHGMKMLAEAMERDLSYKINCPALLICGEKDMAGSAIRYNKAWHKNTGIPLEFIKGAGHNSNTDKPEVVNGLIKELVEKVS